MYLRGSGKRRRPPDPRSKGKYGQLAVSVVIQIVFRIWDLLTS